MRANRIWGKITSGATFEALATALVGFEDPRAALFGRRGQDGGQDIRSGDGTCVYQAKHHERASAAKAIADAKREASKIAKHREPGDSRSAQWASVTDWILVTNATFNATDRETWDEDVIPLFEALGLSAIYWELANLDNLLDKHSEVDRSFFENEIRAFLTASEAHDQMIRDEPFLQRTALGKFVGRDREKQEIRNFLESDSLFLVVHGPGGLGKTRLVLEASLDIAADGDWQVLWALQESMSGSGSWFDAIVPERPTVLVVDEPDSEQLLRKLSEQLGTRMSRWKIVVTARSTKVPVLDFLFRPRMKNRSVALALLPLSAESAEDMCRDLLDRSPSKRTPQVRDEIAHSLSVRVQHHPVWLTLAVALLDRDGDLSKLPETAEALADEYLEEVMTSQAEYPAAHVQATMRWIAILGTVNRQDPKTLELLAEKTTIADGNAVLGLLHRLVERRALVERGAHNRLVEVKPDVLRDRLLTKWLSIDVGREETRPSSDARKLTESLRDAITDDDAYAYARKVLISLGRTELARTLSGRPLRLLDELFSKLIESVPGMTASQRIALLRVLTDAAPFRPYELVQVSRGIRCSPVQTEVIAGLHRKREISNDDVVLDLAWPVYHAAMGARTRDDRLHVLKELLELTQVEGEIAAQSGRSRLPNDGHRAAALLGRTLEGGPEFQGDFREAGRALTMDLLERVKKIVPDARHFAALRAVVRPMTALQRQQEWSEGNTLHMRHYLVPPGESEWATRQEIAQKIKDVLADRATPVESRKLLWELLGRAHADVAEWRDSYSQHPGAASALRQILLDDLTWAQNLLGTSQGALEELKAARKLWRWHAEHDPDPEIKSAAEKLDVIYANDDLVKEFEPLMRFVRIDGVEAQVMNARAKANELSEPGTAHAIEAFLARAVRFLGGNSELSRLHFVAWALGERAASNTGVRDFVERQLAAPPTSQIDFAIRTAESWVAATRRESPATDTSHDLIKHLFAKAHDDQQRIRLLRAVYADSVPGRTQQLPSAEECNWLRSLGDMFLLKQQGPAFISAVGWTLRHDWKGFRATIERVLSLIPSQQLETTTEALIDRVYWAMDRAIEQGAKDDLPPDLVPWLLERLILLPEFDSTGEDGNWKLNQIAERLGSLPISWLPSALRMRREVQAARQSQDVYAWSRPSAFARFVEPISEPNCDTTEVTTAVADIVSLAPHPGTVSYFIPEVLGIIDPNGLVVPAEVARRLNSAMDDDEAYALAKLGSAYAVGSDQWRTIATPAIRRSVDSGTTRGRRSIFTALAGAQSRSWENPVGEVPKIFISAVEDAQLRLWDEIDPEFMPFWEWYLERAQSDLSLHAEIAKEDRGE